MKKIWHDIKTWIPRVALILGALVAGAMLVIAYADWRANEAMIDDGLTTQGLVLNKEYLSPSMRGPSPMHITVQYQINTKTYTYRLLVGSGSYNAVTVGERTTLYYAKDDPYRIAVAHDGIRNELHEEAIARAVIGFGIFFLLCFSLSVALLP